MNRKAIIFGIKGFSLTRHEKIFIKKTKPWGIIIFSRNIKDIDQLKNLISEIKKILNVKKYPILIDQEGGKVSRLNKIIDLSLFSQSYFAKLFFKNKRLFYITYQIYPDIVADIFKKVGININITPVLDVRRNSTHNIIGSRSFSSNPKEVIKLGKICIDFNERNKIATVIKHIPGHGLSKFDTHFKKDIIKEKKKYLMNIDFKPFTNCSSLFAMTCQAVYSAYDPSETATHSKIIINDVIRKKINFNGILISDDISMKALKYNL